METRVQKYKVYRASMISDDSSNYNGKERFTTTTLPLNEVMENVNKENDEKSQVSNKNKKILKIVLFITIGVIVLAGLIVLGIFAFRR